MMTSQGSGKQRTYVWLTDVVYRRRTHPRPRRHTTEATEAEAPKYRFCGVLRAADAVAMHLLILILVMARQCALVSPLPKVRGA